jgi:hypothetical protein
MDRMTKLALLWAIILIVPQSSFGKDPPPFPLEEMTTSSVRGAMNAPYEINIYVDYPGVMSGRTGSTFSTAWKTGGWGANVKLRDATRVKAFASLLGKAPLEFQFKSAEEKEAFLAGVRVVITSGRREKEQYFVNGCQFVRESGLAVYSVNEGLQRYFLPFDLSPHCK